MAQRQTRAERLLTKAPAVRFMALAIFLTGDLLRECTLSSRTSAFDQERRLGRLARLFAISLSTLRHLRPARLCPAPAVAPEGPSLAFPGLKLLLLLEWDAGLVLVTIRQGQPDLRHVR
jgi:hypothetical protein